MTTFRRSLGIRLRAEGKLENLDQVTTPSHPSPPVSERRAAECGLPPKSIRRAWSAQREVPIDPCRSRCEVHPLQVLAGQETDCNPFSKKIDAAFLSTTRSISGQAQRKCIQLMTCGVIYLKGFVLTLVATLHDPQCSTLRSSRIVGDAWTKFTNSSP